MAPETVDTKWLRYVVLLKKTGKPMSPDLLAGHIRHLRDLNRTGQLVLCGPFQDGGGGMLILQASSLEDARRIAQRDPFISSGFETFELRVWELSCEENNHLGAGGARIDLSTNLVRTKLESPANKP